jgi:hypothetical protein
MKIRPCRAVTLLFFTFMMALSMGLSCKKADEGAPGRELPSAITSNAKSVADKAGAFKDQERYMAPEKNTEEKKGLAGHFIKPMELAKQRLLEYRVELTYESNDLMASRRKLLGAVAKYGFISSSNASIAYQSPVATSEVFVKSDKLNEALEEFDTVGTLISESITATDHTEQMVLQERSIRREQVRIARKNAASVQVAPAARNWADIENSLGQSEDRLDASEHARWKIRDKVAWALIRVTLKGPDQPERITVPRYTNAFVGMINILLRLIYVAIYIVPLMVIAGLIIWKKKRVAAFFQRKKKGD